MASNLSGIYTALAAWSFTVNSQTATALYGSTLKGSLGSADLPARLLLPVNGGLEGTNVQGITLSGGHGTATWQIDDLLLVQPVTQGRGIEQVAGALVTYMQQYASQIVSGRRLTSLATVINATPSSGVYEWPADSGKLYYGARMVLEVQEVW